MAELLVVRHGESTWNAEGLWSGQSDPPLTPAGRASIKRLAEELRGFGFSGAASSDLRRASETAGMLAEALQLPPPRTLVGLREREMGLWTGLTRDEISRQWPGWLERWRQAELPELPGGEHRDAFDERVLAALVEVARGSDADARLLVVGHAGTLRALHRHTGSQRDHENLAGVWLAVEGNSIRMLDEIPKARSSDVAMHSANELSPGAREA